MKNLHVLLALVATMGAASAANAQRLGAQLNLGLNSDLGVGGRMESDLTNKLSNQGPLSRAMFVGQLDYYFDTCGGPSGVSCTLLEINPGIVVPLTASRMDPYAGAGFNIARASASGLNNTEIGVNLIGGIRFPLSGFSAFAEGRLALGGAEQLALSFGILFGSNAPRR